MKYQLEITTLLVPVNVHQLFEKCEWPELNCFDREKVERLDADRCPLYRHLFGSQPYQYLETWNHRYGN